jgi:hypothetical protein
MGPSYATKRQESAASMLEVFKMNPPLMAILGDLFIKNQDWPGSQEAMERIRRTMDPKILGEDQSVQIPPQVQAQMQQMQQMVQMLQAQLAEANDKVKLKALEINSKEKIEAAKLETEILIEKYKQTAELAKFEIEMQQAELQRMQGLQPVVQQIPNLNNQVPDQVLAQTQQPTDGMSGPYME